jgi:S1-C subfamily serine protease
VISGSADGADYTLRSLGDGKYELSATKRAEDGRLMEEWKDKGTLKELQEKHAFLRAGLAIQTPAVTTLPVRVKLGESGGVWTGSEVRYGPVGGYVRSVTWNGGGRVGVNVTPPPEELRFHLELPEGAGFIVQQVVPGSRAEQIGIRRMDILLRLDGELIDSPIQLRKLHEQKGVLEVIRRSETRKIDLATFPEWKPADVPPEKVVEEEAPAAGAR